MTDIDTLFQNARLPDGRTVDIAVKNGQISAIAAGLRVAARESTDLKRRLVL
ncbi:MAG: metal-dependent hydrolase, partial [Bradyrhizobiaceae bacterium]